MGIVFMERQSTLLEVSAIIQYSRCGLGYGWPLSQWQRGFCGQIEHVSPIPGRECN